MKRKIVIVGGVATGASAAARLRRLNEGDEIILVEKDEYISFANCGLPYYLGGVIKERSALIVQTKEGMEQRFNIDVRNNTEAIKINREVKKVVLHDKVADREYEQEYDYLILSSGASPVVIPIEGLDDAKNVRILRNIPDTDAIKADLDGGNVKKAVVLGGGFIGIEMAENLRHLGIEVTLLDLAQQVMIPFDEEMAKYVENALVNYGIDVKLETSITRFEEQGKKLVLTNGETIASDLTIMAVGVRPSSQLAKEAGLDLGERGHIVVNEYNQTSDPNIYAGGDATLVKHFITKKDISIPLAWPANRQGRLIADHINGIKTPYNGSLGSSVVKIFDFVASSTGLNERDAKRNGYDVTSVHITRANHAGYYPGASNIVLKVVFDTQTKKVLGAQAFGQEGTEKRIDIIATAIKFGALVSDLADIQTSYAPPFGSAKDPVNIAGYAAENILSNYFIPLYVQDIEKLPEDIQFIDVRTAEEYALGTIKNAKNIPVDVLRNNLDQIDFEKDIYITCQIGQRGYLAARTLINNGFKNKIYNLSGGYGIYKEFRKKKVENKVISTVVGDNQTKVDLTFDMQIDACGLQCPGPIMKLKEGLDSLEKNQVLNIRVSDFGFLEDAKTWTKCTMNTLEHISVDDGIISATIRKTNDNKEVVSNCSTSVCDDRNRQTIVAFSNDFDKLMATFIIANGALSMNKQVSIFFTFWGLSALRKDNYLKKEKKNILDKMFSMMLPKSVKKTGLSKMNMGGLGAKMMRYTMKSKNVDSIESLLQQFIDNGGKIIACTMSMDVMGIKKEELIDGIEYGGVATYIGDSQEAYSNLFI